MTSPLALLCVLGALDGGQHGAPFALHGVEGVPSWEQYRRNELSGAASYAPVSLTRDGGTLVFSGVRQGCVGVDCAILTPGVFVSRVPGASTPPFSRVSFGAVSSVPEFDVRFALLEAEPDGGLHAFIAAGGGDLGPRMDPYFPTGVDALMLHVNLGADLPGRSAEFRQATCATAGSAAEESMRVDYSSELTTPLNIPIPRGAAFSWGLADAGPGLLAFEVLADDALMWRWRFPVARLGRCGNEDDGGYSGGVLDVSRLVPVLYVGWSSFGDPADTTTMTLAFHGYAPRFDPLPAESPVGVTVAVPHSLVSEQGTVVLGVETPVTFRVEGPQPLAPEVTRPGLAPAGRLVSSFTPQQPGVYRLTLELAGADVAAERFLTVTSDAGTVSPPPPPRNLTVGCGCSGAPPGLFAWLSFLLVALMAKRA